MNKHRSTTSVVEESAVANNFGNEASFLSWFVAAVVDPVFGSNNDTINIKNTEYQRDTCHVVDVAGVADPNMSDWTYHKETHGLILNWLEIALSEGYIEPSQPQICKYLDWPTRPFSVNSLWTDFICWLSKNNLPNRDPAARSLFELVCNQVFDRHAKSYTFPELEVCHQRFQEMNKQ